MPTTHFALITDWHFTAPIERVWALIEDTKAWPSWWRAVKRVELLRAGDADGVGAVHRLTWATALPYTLTFDVETIRVERLSEIEGRAFGELDGTGLWTLHTEPEGTHVRYVWRVEVTKPWMRRLAPLLRPIFEWNHNKVMCWGLEGARKRLAEA
jgi:uncharacterized protein YndB with AHSA1/START domain